MRDVAGVKLINEIEGLKFYKISRRARLGRKKGGEAFIGD